MDDARSALIVASDDYTDPGLRRLRAPANDAQALAAVLRDPAIGGFEVRTLLNKPAHEVNLAVEEFFADRRPGDLLLLHFSCHGVKDEDGELYFAASNSVLRRLGATAVAAEFVNRRMNRSRSRRVVLLLDCCYSGAFERGLTARAGAEMGIEQQFGGRGRAVITASSAMEYAFEGDELADARELAPSVFTGALVEGLETGDADRDQDGLVALDELYDYVYDKVRAVTPNQTPGKWTFGVQGELIIARRRRPVTTPTPLPRELQEAIDSPFAAVRAAAVKELVRLLQGSHAGLALGARQAMESLTDDDSRTVSAEATAALRANAPPVDLAEPVRPAEVAAPVASAQVAKPVRQKELAKPVGSADVAEHAPQAEVAVPAAVPPPAQVVQAGPSADATLAGVSPAPVDAAPSVAPPVAAPTAPTAPTAATEPTAPTAPTAATEPTAAKATATTAAPAAATPADGSAAGSAAGSTPPPVDTDDGAASQARDDRAGRQVRDDSAASQAKNDRLLLIAGGLAILGALLTCVGLFPAFVPGVSLISSPTNAWQNFFGAGLDVGAGICLFAPRTRRLIGPGILLSSAAIAAVGPVYDIIVANAYGPAGVGLKLHVVAGVILVVAACLAGLSLARLGEVRVVRMLPEGALPWVVALLGVAGAAALFFQVLGEQDFPGMGRAFILGQDLAPLILTTLLALLVPAAAAVTLPRRFGVALLGAWIAVGVTVVIFYAGSRGNLFGVTLLALVAVIIPFARAAPPTKAERARPAVGNE